MNTLAIERKIVQRLVNRLIAAGYKVSVDDGEEITVRASQNTKTIMDALFTVDEEWLVTHHPEHGNSFVLLVHGNGEDVIADYGTSLPESLFGAD